MKVPWFCGPKEVQKSLEFFKGPKTHCILIAEGQKRREKKVFTLSVGYEKILSFVLYYLFSTISLIVLWYAKGSPLAQK